MGKSESTPSRLNATNEPRAAVTGLQEAVGTPAPFVSQHYQTRGMSLFVRDAYASYSSLN